MCGMKHPAILDPRAVALALDVPPEWSFIAYLCLGWPEAEEASPELERLGWEKRRPIAERLLRR